MPILTDALTVKLMPKTVKEWDRCFIALVSCFDPNR